VSRKAISALALLLTLSAFYRLVQTSSRFCRESFKRVFALVNGTGTVRPISDRYRVQSSSGFLWGVEVDELRLGLFDPWVRRTCSAIQEYSAEALLLQLSCTYTHPVCCYLRFF